MEEKPSFKELIKKVNELEKKVRESKKVEKTVKQNEAFLDGVFNAIQDGISVINPDMTINRVNDVMKKWYAENLPLKGNRCYTCYHNRDQVCDPCPTIRCFQSGRTECEIVPGLPGSSVKWVELFSYPVKDKDSGKITMVVEFVRDITKRVETEELLVESKNRLKIHNRIANIFLTQKDQDMYEKVLEQVLDELDSKYGVFGYIDDEGALVCPSMTKDTWDQCRMTDKNIVFPEDTWGTSIWAHGLRTKKAEYANRSFNVPKGHIPMERCLTAPLVYKDKSIGLLTVANKSVDYTEMDRQFLENIAEYLAPVLYARLEEKKALKALSISEEKYRTLVDTNPDPMIMYDMEGKVIYFNPAFTSVFGWELEERMGKKMDLFVPEDEWEKTHKMIKKVIEGEKFSGIETRRLTKDGKIIFVSISGTIHKGQDGTLVGSIITLRDITDQKRIENQFHQAQKMESLGTLAGGIAHDFNNLLMGIQGRTSLMLLETDSTNYNYEHLKGIEDYIKRAADLTRQLLAFGRGGKYEIKPVDLNNVIYKSSEMFGRTRKEITIQRELQKNIWTVEVDPNQIDQILLNIYVNAWQAMPSGGDLYIRTKNVELDKEYIKPFKVKPGKYVKISITDTGVGMDKAIQRRIFDPFFTTREMGRGTGLGLASVYGIIKNHNGFINVYSEKGEGTTFHIYLPVTESELINEEGRKSKNDILRGNETILLVDDEEMMIDVGRPMLEKLGYKVFVAKNGKQAVSIYKKEKNNIDLVILDMIMPNMGGGQTYDRLKKINSKVKVLLSSGYSVNGQATKILNKGCNGFIQKPFRIKKLSKKIREILNTY